MHYSNNNFIQDSGTEQTIQQHHKTSECEIKTKPHQPVHKHACDAYCDEYCNQKWLNRAHLPEICLIQDHISYSLTELFRKKK